MLTMLDRPTLFIVVSLVALVSALVVFAIWRINRQMQGVVWWLWAEILIAPAFMLRPLFTGLGWPVEFSIVGNNVLLFTSVLLCLEGVFHYRGFNTHGHGRWGLLLIVGFAFISYLHRHNAAQRYVAMDAVVITLLLISAGAMVCFSHGKELLVHGVGASFLLLQAVSSVVRWAQALVHYTDGVDVYSLPYNNVLLLMLIVCRQGWTFGISLACYYRVQSASFLQARKDTLTGLPNRRYLDETLERSIANTQRDRHGVCVVLIDLNNFKRVNDTFGHDAGDAVLVEFATRLTRFVRGVDFACRFGGDEFVVLLHGISTMEQLAPALERMKSMLEGPMPYEGHTIRINVSMGAALFGVHGSTGQALLHAADQFMYRDKPHTHRDQSSMSLVQSPACE